MNGLPFDPAAYLDLPMEEVLEKRPPLMPGDYTAVITDVVPRQWTSQKKTDPTTGQLLQGIAYDLTLTIDIPESERVRCNLKSNTMTLTDGIMVDMLPGGVGFDTSPGRNSRLRQYRDALDMNKAGETFRFSMMKGKALKVRLVQEPAVDRNGQATGDLREAISAVGRI